MSDGDCKTLPGLGQRNKIKMWFAGAWGPSRNSDHGARLWWKRQPPWRPLFWERKTKGPMSCFFPSSSFPLGLHIDQLSWNPAATGEWERQPTGIASWDSSRAGKEQGMDLQEKVPRPTWSSWSLPDLSACLCSGLGQTQDQEHSSQLRRSAFLLGRDAKNVGFQAPIFF